MSGMQPRPTLERIPAGTHTADDLEFLLTADSEQPLVERIPLLRIHHNLNLGKMLLFRVHPGPGTILCEIIPANGVKRLEIVRGSGRIGPSLHYVLSELSALAGELGCECISTVVYSERFLKALLLCGVRLEGWILTYSEAGHGNQD